MLIKENILNDLRENIVEVKFLKSDGTERVMKASLQKSFVEPLIENVDKSTPKKAESSNIVTCIDIEKKEWRRFKIDSIIEYKIIENKEQNNI